MIPASHTPDKWTVITNPTCTIMGEKSSNCTVCGKYYTVSIEKLPHTYGDWVVAKAATCIEKGEKVKTCTCGHQVRTTIYETSHTFGEWKIDVEPTCRSNGTKVRCCTVCDKKETQTLYKVSHDYTGLELTLAPTADDSGTVTKVCRFCYTVSDKTENQTIPALGDAYQGLYEVPDNIISIGKGAFPNRLDLTGIVIPESVKHIGAPGFRYCQNMKDIHIENLAAWCEIKFENAPFGNDFFEYAENLYMNGELVTELVIPEGVTSISKYAFAGCDSITSVHIPASATNISAVREYAFADCKNLKKVFLLGGESERIFEVTLCGVMNTWYECLVFEGTMATIYAPFHVNAGGPFYYMDDSISWRQCNHYFNCNSPNICMDCGAISTASRGHKEVTLEAKAPTCTETGLTAGTGCSRCGTVFTAQQTIEALGHKEIAQEGKAATCTQDGVAAGTKCSVCDAVLSGMEIIPATEHSWRNEKCTVCGEKTENWQAVTRLAGNSRYETSFAIANEMKKVLGIEKFDSIILANSDNFADALAGSYLAAVKNAPIIIGKLKYAGIVCDYVNNNLEAGGTVYVLGGEGAMPVAMLSGITVTEDIQRLAGNDRYATNLAILKKAGVAGKDILAATGQDFADSLSASATGLPILLVNGKPGKTLSEDQKKFLANVEGKIYIIGGESAVPVSMVEQIEAASGKGTERIAGSSRYETSIEIAEQFLSDAESAVVAYASTFPDGLCGGPLAYAVDAPLILTKDGKSEAPAYTKANAITSGYVLGGAGLISDGFAKTIFQATEILK